MATRVVNVAQEAHDVYIGRPSVWGNPFKIRLGFGRRAVIRAYAEWIKSQPALLAQVPALKDKRLGCHCAPLPCHGDVLARLADGGVV